jgi:hypothetical protein
MFRPSITTRYDVEYRQQATVALTDAYTNRSRHCGEQK